MSKFYVFAGVATLAACATVTFSQMKAGLVEFGGAQKTIFTSGKAEAVVPLVAFSGNAGVYGVGAVAELDGEITVFNGKTYVTKVRGNAYAMGIGGFFSEKHPGILTTWCWAVAWFCACPERVERHQSRHSSEQLDGV